MRRKRLNGSKKLVGLLTAMGLTLVLAAGVAVAQPQPEPPTITCTGGVCLGTEGPDLILGTDGFDLILARGSADGVNAQGGNDLVFGDNLDYLDCGAGEDNVYMADPGDTVLANCQRNIGPQ